MLKTGRTLLGQEVEWVETSVHGSTLPFLVETAQRNDFLWKCSTTADVPNCLNRLTLTGLGKKHDEKSAAVRVLVAKSAFLSVFEETHLHER